LRSKLVSDVFYISSSGSDTNIGTDPSYPFLTISLSIIATFLCNLVVYRTLTPKSCRISTASYACCK
jgi:hypothetical protein